MRFAAIKSVLLVALTTLAWTAAPQEAPAGDAQWKRAAHTVTAWWRAEPGRQAKAWVRTRVVRPSDLEQFGISCDPRWEQCDAGPRTRRGRRGHAPVRAQ